MSDDQALYDAALWFQQEGIRGAKNLKVVRGGSGRVLGVTADLPVTCEHVDGGEPCCYCRSLLNPIP